MSSPRNILSDSRDIYGALSGMPGSDSPSLTSNSDSNNNLFDKPIYPGKFYLRGHYHGTGPFDEWDNPEGFLILIG